MNLKTLIWILVCSNGICVVLSTPCTTDLECEIAYKEDPFIECVNNQCACKEFFTLYGRDPKCIKGSSLDKPCEANSQCQIILGQESRCAAPDEAGGAKRCECWGGAEGDNVAHFEGKCFVLKAYGEPCTHDSQCKLDLNGTIVNPLGICTEENVCGCYVDSMIPSHNMGGMCMVHCKDCAGTGGVDISLLAITLAGSAALLVFIYIMFRLASRDTRIVKRESVEPLSTTTIPRVGPSQVPTVSKSINHSGEP